MSSKTDLKSRTLLGTHRKRTCKVRSALSLALHSDSIQTEDLWISYAILKLSLGSMNFSLALDSTRGYSSFL